MVLQELWGVLCCIGLFAAILTWFSLGRVIILLVVNDFKWDAFVKDYKSNIDDSFIETLCYYLFPITLLYLLLARLFKKLKH